MGKKYITLRILLLFLFIGPLLLSQKDALIELEVGTSIIVKIEEDIITKGFEGVMVYQNGKQQYVRLEELKSIEFLDKEYVKQSIKYESIEADILISSFILGEVILYEGYQLNGAKLFFISSSKKAEIIQINNKGMDNFFNYYFKDCDVWNKITKNQYVYSKDWLAKLAEKNSLCFDSSSTAKEQLIIDYVPKKVHLAVGGKFYFYQVGINSSTNNFLYDPDLFDDDNGMSFAGLFQVVFNDKIQIQQAVSWYQFETYHGNINYYPFSIPENYSELSLKTSYLEFQTSVKVNLFTSKITPYVEGGSSIDILLDSSTEEVNYQRIGYENLPKDYYFNKRQVGLFLGFGMEYCINHSLRIGFNYQLLIHRFSINIRGRNPNIGFGQRRHHLGIYAIHDL